MAAMKIFSWLKSHLVEPTKPPEWPHKASDPQEWFQFANKWGQWFIDWYDVKNDRKKKASFVWRAAAIIASTLAVLIPVVYPGDTKWGYFCALLGVAFLTIDRSFGFTSSWVRTVTASRAIDTSLTRFRAEWTRLMARRPEPPVQDLAQCLEDFLLRTRNVIDEEARTWATETIANFSHLERVIGEGAAEARRQYEAKVESLRAGAIQLTIENPPSPPWRCDVLVNGGIRKTEWSGQQCGIANVLPGVVEVEVRAKASDTTEWVGSGVAVVPSGAISAPLFVRLSQKTLERLPAE